MLHYVWLVQLSESNSCDKFLYISKWQVTLIFQGPCTCFAATINNHTTMCTEIKVGHYQMYWTSFRNCVAFANMAVGGIVMRHLVCTFEVDDD